MLQIRKIGPLERPLYGSRLQAFEREVEYRRNDEICFIDHGDDYFAFFDRLGEAHHFVLEKSDRIVGVGCGILRTWLVRDRLLRAWYMCDGRILPAYRKQGLGARLLSNGIRRLYLPSLWRTHRVFGISMDIPGRRNNPITEMVKQRAALPFSESKRLAFYSLDATTMRDALPIVERFRGPLRYASLRGHKDWVVKSSGMVLPMLHVQYGPHALPGAPAPCAAFQHRFCAPLDDALIPALTALGIVPSQTATVVHFGMTNIDFAFLMTSDI